MRVKWLIEFASQIRLNYRNSLVLEYQHRLVHRHQIADFQTNVCVWFIGLNPLVYSDAKPAPVKQGANISPQIGVKIILISPDYYEPMLSPVALITSTIRWKGLAAAKRIMRKPIFVWSGYLLRSRSTDNAISAGQGGLCGTVKVGENALPEEYWARC